MQRRLLLTLLLCLFSFAALAQIPLKPHYPDRYVVKRGDTLWHIAGIFLQNPWQWPDIWHKNTNLHNPHLIYPGDILALQIVKGQPQLRIIKQGTIKLSPRIREFPNDSAIPSIPLEDIKPFLKHSQVVSKEFFETSPYIVAHANDRMLAGSYDKIYVRGIKNHDITNFDIVRKEDTYVDPDTDKTLGYEAKFLGKARLLKVGDPATLETFQVAGAIRTGDRLIPQREIIYNDFQPHATKDPHITGKIIDVVGGITKIGQYDAVAINLGKDQGVDPGTVFAIYHHRGEVDDDVEGGDVKIPDYRIGNLMVFDSYNHMSYALVLEATQTIRVKDLIKHPQ